MREFPTLHLIELNEINFDIVKQYYRETPEKFPGFSKLFKMNMLNTKSESVYENLEPWIQWVSVHTGKTFSEHKVFRLGDITKSNHPQIFEKIESMGFNVGCVSPMNAENRLKRPAFFIPDPWTDTHPDDSWISKKLHLTLKQAVNDNAQQKVTISSYLIILATLLRYGKFKNYRIYLKLFQNRNKKWNKALFLDLLLSDVYSSLQKGKNLDFSCLFLNSFAHVQQHYMLNSRKVDSSLTNKESYILKSDDPIFDAVCIFDRIIDQLIVAGSNYIFATGLSQVPVEKQVNYYRLTQHSNFLDQLSIKHKGVLPRMTRDFEIVFESEDQLAAGLKSLRSIKIEDEPIFNEIEQRKNSLFVTLTFNGDINSETYAYMGDKRISMEDNTIFVASKNGHHCGQGYAFLSKTLMDNEKPNFDHVANIGRYILSYFEDKFKVIT